MRIFKNAWFVRFARSQEISDDTLREAIMRAENGQVDADLGGGVLNNALPDPGKESRKAIGQSFYFDNDKARFLYTDLPKMNEAT